ncbi:MAG: lactate utilization protein B [Conexivisphaerales archaeon]
MQELKSLTHWSWFMLDDEYFLEVKRRVYSALDDSIMQKGVQRGMASFLSNLTENLGHEHVLQLAGEVKEFKRHSISNMAELLKQAVDSIQRNGVAAYIAKDKDDAKSIIKKLTDDDRIIVKSKSMVAEEIGLRNYLISLGKEVWETDLGEFIIQLRGDKPAQMVAPSLHVPREEVARLLSDFFKVDFGKDDLKGMVDAVRNFLREKIAKADTGITGANAISAREGALLTVENEGNIRLTMTLPKKHIVLSSIEKIVPTTTDALKVCLAQSYYAGYTKPTYISLTSTPSGTGDIEKVMVRPAQGSREMHVVLLDNGRSLASSSEFSDMLRCIKCGACQMVCPSYAVMGPSWGGKVYTAAIGLVWTAITESIDEAESLSYFCLSCDACNEVCPVGIDVSGLIKTLRKKGSSNLMNAEGLG